MSRILSLKALLKEAAKYILRYHHRVLTPTEQRHDDLYLVSLLKSGNTWLSFLMANIHLKMSGLSREVNFFNICDFISDLSTEDISFINKTASRWISMFRYSE